MSSQGPLGPPPAGPPPGWTPSPYGSPPPYAPRRRRTGLWVGLVVLALVVAGGVVGGVVAFTGSSSSGPTSSGPVHPTPFPTGTLTTPASPGPTSSAPSASAPSWAVADGRDAGLADQAAFAFVYETTNYRSGQGGQKLRDVRSLVTSRFRSELDHYAPLLAHAHAASRSTIGVSALESYDGDAATVLVAASTTVTRDGGRPQTSPLRLVVDVVRGSRRWLVAGLQVAGAGPSSTSSPLLADAPFALLPASLEAVLSYTPGDVGQAGPRENLLTGAFARSYRRLLPQLVSAVRAGHITTRTQVDAIGVRPADHLRPGFAQALVFLSERTTRGAARPTTTQAAALVTVRLVGGEWKIAAVRSES